MNTNLSSNGASFIAHRQEHNPRDFVIELVKNHPEATRQELFDQFRAMVQDGGDDYQRAIDWYFFVNMHDYLVTNRNRKSADPVERQQRQERQRQVVESIKAQIVMLDLTMPNGKSMRDCSGAEMAKFGNRFQRIADQVGKSKLVGAVLSEEQVQALMK